MIKEKLDVLFKDHNANYQYNFLKKDNVFKEVEDLVVSKSIQPSNTRQFMCNLWNLEKQNNINLLSEDCDFQRILSEILESQNFKDSGNYIVYQKNIEIKIIDNGCNINILSKRNKDKLSDIGYGIKSFKIEKSKNIINVFCDGKHPNLNPVSKCFCLNSTCLNMEFSIKSINLIIESLSQVYLKSHFLETKDYILFEEAIT